MSYRLLLAPLDERPVNTRYPEMLAAIGKTEILLPPADIRGLQRTPADVELLVVWLLEASVDADVCIVSCDYLGYGNLINSRISGDGVTIVMRRLAFLEEVSEQAPVHAFSLITRVANADDCVEEPLYWEKWGTRLYKYARLKHLEEHGVITSDDASDLAVLEGTIPQELKADWLTRRLRNHTVNLALLDMAERGQIASLLLTSDDTATYGFPSRERDWLRTWPQLIGRQLTDRVRMHPGADEVGSVLVAKLINEAAGRHPAVWVDYAISGDDEIVAPYEDRPIKETVAGQIEACGCRLAATVEAADFVLGVVTPSPRRSDYRYDFLDQDRAERTEPYKAFLKRLIEYAKPIAIADVAYPNGSDALFSELLLGGGPVSPGTLAAYGGWNTAGNTLGVVVAQAALSTGNPESVEAQRLFLAHRFLEDCGYQLCVRREARAHAETLWQRREPDPASDPEQRQICAFIERRLCEVLGDLQQCGVGKGLKLVPGSVQLPWRRLFEVDFQLA